MIIYLNGASSAGKTTLAKALQQALKEPYLHIGMDHLISWMPHKLNDWEKEGEALGFSWEKGADKTGNLVYQLRVGPFGKKILKTLIDVVLLLASQRYNLIIDDIALDPLTVTDWRSTLKKYVVLYVGVTLPLEILEEREHLRGDRMLGSARGQYFTVHENTEYDVEINTYTQTLEENVEKIQKALLQKQHKKG